MGGSFSPPTMAHFEALQAAVQRVSGMYPTQHIKGLFVPVSIHYNKESVKAVSEEDRIAMLEMGTKWLNAYRLSPDLEYAVSTHEMEAGRAVPTIESLEILKAKDPSGTYFLALGQDNLESLLAGKWKRSQDLVNLVRILYFVRPDATKINSKTNVKNFPKDVRPAFPLEKIEFDAASISSTRLRKALQGAEDPKYLTRPDIIDYIREKKLYGVKGGGGKRSGGKRKTRRHRLERRATTCKKAHK
jgi:nicotinate (nicotinamide) nucleotide adenylyltransferase